MIQENLLRNNSINKYVNSFTEESKYDDEADFLITTLTAIISGFTERKMDDKIFEIYQIRVTDHFHKKTWILEKEQNDFEILRKNLAITFLDVPMLPSRIMAGTIDLIMSNKKKGEMQNFLKNCINRKDIFSSEEFKEFLQIEVNSPELCGNTPVMKGKLEYLPQSISNFKYIPEESIIILTTSELGVSIKTNPQFLCFKNRLEEKEEDFDKIQGLIMIFKIEKSEERFEFIQLWQKKVPVQTTSLFFDEISKFFFVGYEDGFIAVFKVNPKTNYTEVDFIIQLKNHFSRVTGIWYDSSKSKLYSVSTDRRFTASEATGKHLMKEVNRSVYNYTGLLPDKKNERLFASTDGGIIELYSTEDFPPVKKKRFKISGLGNISDLFLNIQQFYLYTCDKKGKITVIELGQVGREKYSSELSQFGLKNSLNVIKYDSEKHEFITGDEFGKIIVWDIKTGQPIFSWIAHDNPITSLYYDEKVNLLISGSKDKSIKVWELPKNWFNPEMIQFEKEELRKINSEIARKRLLMKKLIQDDNDIGYESGLSEDDINGWNIDEENY